MPVTAPHDVEAAAAAAQCVVRIHQRLVEFIRAGQTLAAIDRFVAIALDDLDCTSAFLRYRIRGHPPFPSFACLSLNDCIVHGTHDLVTRPIEPGDLLKVDIGVKHQGWVGDAAWTYAIEHAEPQVLKLMHCGREALRRGMAAMKGGRPLIDWARAVQEFVEKQQRFHLVRGLGGHGYGRQLHGPPFISNVAPAFPGEWNEAWMPFVPGMLLAVEPMIAGGTGAIQSRHGQWPIFTADGSLSVHYEADVLITDDGPRDLTEGMGTLPDIVG
jgi:methionyl aminopeptidase